MPCASFKEDDYDRAINKYEQAAGLFRFVLCANPNWKKEGIKDEELTVVDDTGDGRGPVSEVAGAAAGADADADADADTGADPSEGESEGDSGAAGAADQRPGSSPVTALVRTCYENIAAAALKSAQYQFAISAASAAAKFEPVSPKVRLTA